MMAETKCELQRLITCYPELNTVQSNIEAGFSIIYKTLAEGRILYLCGNGGSAADAEHIAGELMKGFMNKRPLSEDTCKALDNHCGDPKTAKYLKEHLQQGCRVISLTGHVALSTAMSNDVASDLVFAQQLNALGRPGDTLLAISTSGNARNVELCAQVARALNINVVALTGHSGGRLKKSANVVINVPSTETPRVQELHLPVYHALCFMLEAALFPYEEKQNLFKVANL